MLNLILAAVVCALVYVTYRLMMLESEVRYLAGAWVPAVEDEPALLLPTDDTVLSDSGDGADEVATCDDDGVCRVAAPAALPAAADAVADVRRRRAIVFADAAAPPARPPTPPGVIDVVLDDEGAPSVEEEASEGTSEEVEEEEEEPPPALPPPALPPPAPPPASAVPPVDAGGKNRPRRKRVTAKQ